MNISLLVIAFMALSLTVYIISKLQLPAKIKKAEEYLENDEQQKASDIVKKILLKQKDFVPARYLRAMIYIKQKQYLLAISELNSIITIQGFAEHINEIDLHYHLAELYNKTQQWPKEIEEYKNILTFNPDDLIANYRIGHVFYKQLKYQECIDHLEKAYLKDSTLIDCLVPLGISYFNLGDYVKSEEYLLKSLDTNADNLETHFYMGHIYKFKKDHETALKMFKSAKRDKSLYMKSIEQMGEIYFENEMYEEAISILEEGLGSLANRGEEAMAYRYLLAQCYERSNKIIEAVYHWQKIFEQNSNYKNTKSKLDDYKEIMENENQKVLFTSSLDDLQPLIIEVIARLNYNIISKNPISINEYLYKVLNIKRINEPPILILFNRTTNDISESQIVDLFSKIGAEKCKGGIYMTTSKFSAKAKNTAQSMLIELLDSSFLNKAVEKIMLKRPKQGVGQQ